MKKKNVSFLLIFVLTIICSISCVVAISKTVYASTLNPVSDTTISNDSTFKSDKQIEGNYRVKKCKYATDNHKVILNGTEHQNVLLENNDSQFNILCLTQSLDNYTFNPKKCWKKLETDYILPPELDPNILKYGSCGTDVFWMVNANGVLTIYGNGKMADYTEDGALWCEYRDVITEILVLEGVCHIGDNSFAKCNNLKNVVLPIGLETIGKSAFANCSSLNQITISQSVTEIKDKAFLGVKFEMINLYSEKIAQAAVNAKSCGYLFDGEPTVVMSDNINSVGAYFTSEFPYSQFIISFSEEKYYTVYSWHEHQWSREVIIEAVPCVDEGCGIDTCSVCGIKNDVIISPHDLKQVAKQDATCSEIGWEEYEYCTKFDHTTYKEIPAKDHDYVTEIIEPTCTEKGYTVHTCTNCKDVITEEIPALGHNYVTETIEPTCTAKGYTVHTCTNCKDVITEEIPKREHEYILISIDSNPTCTQPGSTTNKCYYCGVVDHGEIPAYGHEYYKLNTVEPTCTEKGYTSCACVNCGDVITEEIPEREHEYILISIDSNPTCTQPGSTTNKCYYCGVVDHGEIPAYGHEYYKLNTVEPTCTEKGYTSCACANCGDIYNKNYVGALGHDLDGNGKCTRCTYSGAVSIVELSNKKGSDFTENTYIAGKLQELFELLPYSDYPYFTITGRSCGNSFCSQCNGMNVSKYHPMLKDAGVYDNYNSYSCMAMARYTYYYIFGVPVNGLNYFGNETGDLRRIGRISAPGNDRSKIIGDYEEYTIENFKSLIAQGTPGDIIQGRNNNGSNHSMVFLKADENGVYILHSNAARATYGSNRVLISYYTYDQLAQWDSIITLYRAPENIYNEIWGQEVVDTCTEHELNEKDVCINCDSPAKDFCRKNSKLYFYQNGKKVSGWFEYNGVKYYASSVTNVVINYNKTIGGKYYIWNDETGLTLADGFYFDGVGTKCYDDGYPVIGWRHTDGSGPKVENGISEQYSTNPEGLYYFLSTTGYMVTDETYTLGGYLREFNADHTVKPLNGLQNRYGELYYYVDGVIQTGWQTIDGVTYYFRASDDVYGRAATKWMYIGNKVYYFYASTSATPYALKTEGAIGGITYEYHEDGYIIYDGFVNVDYANAANNNTAPNIQKMNGTTRYYVDGEMQTGWQEINGETYYFYAIGSSMGSGYMCCESRSIGGVWYEFTADGLCTNK